jgi:methylmalonyl-CoA mutase N-terminal domain/subunit
LALPTQEAALIALRTQQVIACESGVTNTIDPLAGSYCVEKLTTEMEEGAVDYLHRIEDMGGMVRAVELGFPQREIADSAYAYQRAVEKGEKLIVGVNTFVEAEEKRPIPILIIDEALRDRQVARLERLRKTRDKDRWQEALDALRAAALGKDPWGEDLMMPKILDAVQARATVGEIVGTLREVWGEYTEPSII